MRRRGEQWWWVRWLSRWYPILTVIESIRVMSTTSSTASATRRYTTIRVIAYHGILKNFTSILQFFSIGMFIFNDKSSSIRISWSWQLWTIQGISLAVVIIGVVANVALAFHRPWGRTLDVAIWCIGSLSTLVLSTWVSVVVSLPLAAIIFPLMYNRLSTEYLSHLYIENRPTARVSASFGLLAASSALHYWAISYSMARTGFFAYVMPNGRPMSLLIAAAVTLGLGVAIAPRGSRMWSCGMSLMTSAVAISVSLVH